MFTIVWAMDFPDQNLQINVLRSMRHSCKTLDSQDIANISDKTEIN